MAGVWQAGDVWLFRLINADSANWFLDQLTARASNATLMLWPLAALMLGLCVWGGFRGRVAVLLALLCLAIGDPLITNTVKHTVARPRPYQCLDTVRRVVWENGGVNAKCVYYEEHQRAGKYRSMPSSHVANNVSWVLALTLVYGWRRCRWLWCWPLFMMFSRVYTGDHFPSDAVAGFLLGAAYTLLICCIADKVWQNYGRRLASKLYDKHPTLLANRCPR